MFGGGGPRRDRGSRLLPRRGWEGANGEQEAKFYPQQNGDEIFLWELEKHRGVKRWKTCLQYECKSCGGNLVGIAFIFRELVEAFKNFLENYRGVNLS